MPAPGRRVKSVPAIVGTVATLSLTAVMALAAVSVSPTVPMRHGRVGGAADVVEGQAVEGIGEVAQRQRLPPPLRVTSLVDGDLVRRRPLQ